MTDDDNLVVLVDAMNLIKSDDEDAVQQITVSNPDAVIVGERVTVGEDLVTTQHNLLLHFGTPVRGDLGLFGYIPLVGEWYLQNLYDGDFFTDMWIEIYGVFAETYYLDGEALEVTDWDPATVCWANRPNRDGYSSREALTSYGFSAGGNQQIEIPLAEGETVIHDATITVPIRHRFLGHGTWTYGLEIGFHCVGMSNEYRYELTLDDWDEFLDGIQLWAIREDLLG